MKRKFFIKLVGFSILHQKKQKLKKVILF